ncbi:hypothetical protein [Aliarcobacter butzleri]|uniref:hypothetical protein n=1 Tax=Aliarcobacter butzleri TaxID=28197 RepID=UPI0021B46165|nr:hypothetical protein [Aliarcobacter butzleri]MCT7602284.1 hypothetical protein [Aliarcobacter butzleri]
MKNLLLIALLILGVVFTGCASKEDPAINITQGNSASFAGSLLSSGNPVLMGVGALVGTVSVVGIESGDNREQYNSLNQEQKEQYVQLMQPCMRELNIIKVNTYWKYENLSQEEKDKLYKSKMIETLSIRDFDRGFVWRNGLERFSEYRDACHPKAIQEILGTTEQIEIPVSETKETTQNQTSTNNDEK